VSVDSELARCVAVVAYGDVVERRAIVTARPKLVDCSVEEANWTAVGLVEECDYAGKGW